MSVLTVISYAISYLGIGILTGRVANRFPSLVDATEPPVTLPEEALLVTLIWPIMWGIFLKEWVKDRLLLQIGSFLLWLIGKPKRVEPNTPTNE